MIAKTIGGSTTALVRRMTAGHSTGHDPSLAILPDGTTLKHLKVHLGLADEMTEVLLILGHLLEI